MIPAVKILLVTQYFAPDGGAAAIRLTALARYLTETGHDVRVLTTMPHYPQGSIQQPYNGRVFTQEVTDGVHVVRTWLWATSSPKIRSKLFSQLSFAWMGFWRGLHLPRPDVVLIEAQPMFASLMARWLGGLKRVPYVLNVSDLWPDHLLSTDSLQASHPVYRIAQSVTNRGYRGANAIVTLSPAWSQKIIDHVGNRVPIHTVYRGVDVARFTSVDQQSVDTWQHSVGIPNGKKIVSFIGTFATQYDFDLLKQAIRLCSLRSDTHFLLVGTGSQRESVEGFIAGMPNCTWIPWLQPEDIPNAWAVSDLTIWAMRQRDLYLGTIPAKLYEAFASGTPIVAAQGGESAALIRMADAGITVDPGDEGRFLEAIEIVLQDDGQRRIWSESAQAYALTHFDFSQTARHYEEILRAVVEPSG